MEAHRDARDAAHRRNSVTIRFRTQFNHLDLVHLTLITRQPGSAHVRRVVESGSLVSVNMRSYRFVGLQQRLMSPLLRPRLTPTPHIGLRRFTNLTPEDTAVTNVKAKWQLNFGGDEGAKKWEVRLQTRHRRIVIRLAFSGHERGGAKRMVRVGSSGNPRLDILAPASLE